MGAGGEKKLEMARGVLENLTPANSVDAQLSQRNYRI